MNLSLLTFVVLSTLGADPHVEANPLYRELREKGIAVSADQRVPLPEPTIADGIDGPTLRAKLTAIPGRHTPVEELLRNSIVSGLVVSFRDVEAKDRSCRSTAATCGSWPTASWSR